MNVSHVESKSFAIESKAKFFEVYCIEGKIIVATELLVGENAPAEHPVLKKQDPGPKQYPVPGDQNKGYIG